MQAISHNYVDILTLDRFYKSALGQAAALAISQRLHLMWPNPQGEMVAVGYGPPFLENFYGKNIITHAMMPARQGVMAWPEHSKKRVALVDEYNLPLPDSSVDYLILVHVIEHAHRPDKLLREMWRVLSPSGKIAVIAPNRRRIWSSLERSPFGYGRPFSASQLHQLLIDKLLSPIRTDHALFLPPFDIPAVGPLLNTAEWAARGWLRRWGGILIVEAEKQVYGGILQPTGLKRAVTGASAPDSVSRPQSQKNKK
jgi:SAM-dependent methyltransferase